MTQIVYPLFEYRPEKKSTLKIVVEVVDVVVDQAIVLELVVPCLFLLIQWLKNGILRSVYVIFRDVFSSRIILVRRFRGFWIDVRDLLRRRRGVFGSFL